MAGTISEYDCVRQPEGYQRAQFIGLEDDDHMKAALKSLKPAADTPTWSALDPKVGRPRSFVIEAAGPNDSKVQFFGRLTKGQQLEGPGKLLAFVEGDRFRALMDQKVYIVDARFDCVAFHPFLFVMRPTGFESLFAYETQLVAKAGERIDSLKSFLSTEKLVVLRSAIGTNRNLLRQIAGRIRIDLNTADPARIKVAIAKCKLNVTLEVKDGKMKLDFEGNDPQGLIQLLTDRAVEGLVSGHPYIAPALLAVGES